MTHLLALDQGTSSSRSIVFDGEGRIVAMAQRELTQHYPQAGWVEHDPLEIWQTQLATAREALHKAGLQARDLAAIGITNQRETTLLWERATGRPLHRAIVWQDRRAEPTCAALREAGHAELVARKTGLVIDAYFSGTKLKWLLDQVPGARERAARGELAFGTVDAWLVWQLTGGRVHATDVSNASRTMLFDVRRNQWDDELLALLDIPRGLLPDVHPSAHRYAETDAALLGAPVTIGGIAGDQQSALFGQACFSPGLAKNTYGTGCFLLMHTGERFQPSQHGLVATSAAQCSATPEYAFEGSVFIGGAVVQWLRDGLKAISASSEIEALAASVPDAGGVVLVPAFTGLGAPYWHAQPGGAIVGLTRGSTVAHVARAALESIAFQSAALLQAMELDAKAAGSAPVTELRVDGGACVNNLLMQFQADLLGLPVVRPQVIETTALGAAYLAGLAVGVWPDRETLARQWRAERRFEPQMPRDEAAERMARWERAVRQTMAA
ncbi:glycerol kinase GlpK [Aquabacterium sp. J223]|uniref:glycerol kinase GlpK n=1 Tax=Aquabacterium sp. J223 TaxID=2898431 RepID=UPI0021AD571C|nr:glycerol kinase GlpK [Aquabacterium sp. J223]UUX96071.1 glycerol kinase GlpK [Aquabacterium sp. J223]